MPNSESKNQTEQHEQFRHIKVAFINTIWMGVFTITFLVLPLSLSRATFTGWLPFYSVHLALGLCVATIAIFFKKISDFFKAALLVLFLWLAAVPALFTLGLVSISFICLSGACVVAIIAFPKRIAIVVVFLSCSFPMVAAICFVTKLLQSSVDLNEYQTQPVAWIFLLLVMWLFTATICFAGHSYSRAINEVFASLEERVDKRTRELERSRQAAEASSNAKGDFLANMSHEIRTPLNGVIGMAYLALKAANDPRQRDYLEKIHRSGEHLLGIVNDILTYSKVEAGKLEIEDIDFSLDEMVQNFTNLVGGKASEKRLDFRVELDQNLPISLRGDPLRLVQVLVNFIGNAIKFTERGSVIVSIRKLDDAADRFMVQFNVRDSGIGISAETVSQLFQSFQQADNTITRKFGGTGLGLAISKQLVELMHGQVGVISELGQGSTFWFKVPLRKGVTQILPTHHALPDAAEDKKSLSGVRILVAEDNEFNQQIALELLQAAGAIVEIVGDGKQAVDRLQSVQGALPFDCVLMDLQMPVMGGIEATTYLRTMPAFNNLPIIAMTANAYGEDRDQCKACGMNDFISKPVKPEALYATVAKWVGSQNGVSELRDDAVAATPPASAAPVSKLVIDSSIIDLSILAEMVNRNQDMVRKFAIKFIESADKGLLEIETALANQDVSNLKALGHRVKSSAKTVGALGFAGLCERLEKIEGDAPLVQAQELVAEMRPLLEKIQVHIKHQLDEPTTASVHAAEAITVLKQVTSIADLCILVVDDEPFQTNYLSSLLRDLGINNIAVNNDAALALVDMRSQHFDALFCDLKMPGMDGIEFLRLVALQNFKGSVVLVSEMDASVLAAAERLIKEHGLNYCDTLKKPVSENTLKSLLARVKKVEASTEKSQPSALLSEDDLYSGLAADAIELHYQPKVSLLNRRILAVECLARWRHPTRGIVGPAVFVPALEQHGLIDEFTFAVIRKAATQLAIWMQQGFDFKVAVNVSMNNINRLDIPEKFDGIVRDAGVMPSSVIFEMTETRLMDNLVISLEILTRLRLKGFGLSVDDFGTGFSSMENLKLLPFSELKIDRAFVSDPTHDKSIRAVLESSTQLGKLFKLDLVAEGVETQEDWDIVSQAGCDAAQGYFIAKPMLAKDFIDWKIKWEEGI